MRRLPKWVLQRNAGAPEYLKGKGDNWKSKLRFSDSAAWLGRIEAAWADALYEVDRTRDLSPLIRKLKDVVPAVAYPHLVDLARRYVLKQRKRGRAPTPSYDRTMAEILLEEACRSVRGRPKGMPLDKTIDEASFRWSIPVSTLRNAYHGWRRSTKTMKKRRIAGL
jgi:hypothetical protein